MISYFKYKIHYFILFKIKKTTLFLVCFYDIVNKYSGFKIVGFYVKCDRNFLEIEKYPIYCHINTPFNNTYSLLKLMTCYCRICICYSMSFQSNIVDIEMFLIPNITDAPKDYIFVQIILILIWK